MILGACSKGVKFLNWPDITILGQYDSPDKQTQIKSFSWNNEGNQIICVHTNGNATLVKPPISNESKIQTIRRLNCANINTANYSYLQDNIAVIGTSRGEVKIFDLARNCNVSDYQKLNSSVELMEFLCNDDGLVVACSDGQLVLYGKNKTTPFMTLEVPYSRSVTTLATHKSKPNLICAGSLQGYTSVWNAETGDITLVSEEHCGSITNVQFYESTVASSGADGNFIMHDLNSRKVVSSKKMDVGITAFSFMEDSYELALSTSDGQILRFDTRFLDNHNKAIVVYPGLIRKVAFPRGKAHKLNNHLTMPNSHELPRSVTSWDDSFFDYKSSTAAGDFLEIGCRSVENSCENLNESVVLTEEDFTKFRDEIHSKISEMKIELENKMFKTFYDMRVKSSKKFIFLENCINNNFNGKFKCASASTSQFSMKTCLS